MIRMKMENTPMVLDMDAHPAVETYQRFFGQLRRAGIGWACGTLQEEGKAVLSHVSTEVEEPEERQKILGQIIRHNQAALKLAAVEPSYIPAMPVHPDCVEGSLEQIEAYGLQKIRVLEAEGAWIECPGMEVIWEAAMQRDMLVNLRESNRQQVDKLAMQFQGLKIAACLQPAEAAELMEKYPNVYIKMCGVWYGNYYLHEWCRKVDTKRILFASGYPDCNPASKTAAVGWELRDQLEEIKQDIFNGNAWRAIEGQYVRD